MEVPSSKTWSSCSRLPWDGCLDSTQLTGLASALAESGIVFHTTSSGTPCMRHPQTPACMRGCIHA